MKKTNPKALSRTDRNGWTPLHEAARSGHLDAVKLLIDFGVDKNARTHKGKGSTPLSIAKEELTENHPVARFLMGIGGLDIGPDEL